MALTRTRLSSQRGVALPMALMTLMLLTTLMLAFAVLSQTEPVIAANQLRVAQARALADSGFEYAVWALTNSTNASGLGSPLPLASPGDATSSATGAFNGATFVALSAGGASTGGFTVRVRNDQTALADPNVREILAVGWTPVKDPTDPRTKGHRQIFAQVQVFPNLALAAPCALCVKGGLAVIGNSSISGNDPDPACGGNNKFATFTKDDTTAGGSGTLTGGTNLTAPSPVSKNNPESAFKGFTLSSLNLNSLKALAKANGTYFGPGYPNGGLVSDGSATWSGTVNFDSGNPVGNGVVFVDTTDGQNVDPTTPTGSMTTLASVNITGSPFSAGAFSGWMVVNGSLVVTGGMQINGLVYAVNDFSYSGTGGGGINGLAISQNIRDTDVSSIDSATGGNSNITFNCQNSLPPTQIPKGFTLVPGSYREQAD